MKKTIIGVLVLLVCAVILIVVARNFIVKTAVVKGIEKLAGVKVEMQKINIGLMSPTVEINSLKVYNPSKFADKLMADIPQIYVNYDLGGFFKNRVHLNKVRIEIKELSAVLDERGELNLNSLALLMPKPSGSKPAQVNIDELFLKIGKVGYKGYFPVLGTKTMEFNPDIEETFKDVTNPAKVAGDILKKILSQIGIADLAKVDIGGEVAKIKQSAAEALNTNIEAVGSSAKEIESSVRGSLDKTKEDLKNIFSQ